MITVFFISFRDGHGTEMLVPRISDRKTEFRDTLSGDIVWRRLWKTTLCQTTFGTLNPLGNEPHEISIDPMGLKNPKELESQVVPKLEIRLSQRFLSRDCPSDICLSPKRPKIINPIRVPSPGICLTYLMGSQSHCPSLISFSDFNFWEWG